MPFTVSALRLTNALLDMHTGLKRLNKSEEDALTAILTHCLVITGHLVGAHIKAGQQDALNRLWVLTQEAFQFARDRLVEGTEEKI